MNAVDDLLSASPEELAAASAASFETLALANDPNDDGTLARASAQLAERYRPTRCLRSAASNDSAARHSLLGTSLPPPARTTVRRPVVHVPRRRLVGHVGGIPTVSNTKTAVPQTTANLSVPPPPPGPPRRRHPAPRRWLPPRRHPRRHPPPRHPRRAALGVRASGNRRRRPGRRRRGCRRNTRISSPPPRRGSSRRSAYSPSRPRRSRRRTMTGWTTGWRRTG